MQWAYKQCLQEFGDLFPKPGGIIWGEGSINLMGVPATAGVIDEDFRVDLSH